MWSKLSEAFFFFFSARDLHTYPWYLNRDIPIWPPLANGHRNGFRRRDCNKETRSALQFWHRFYGKRRNCFVVLLKRVKIHLRMNRCRLVKKDTEKLRIVSAAVLVITYCQLKSANASEAGFWLVVGSVGVWSLQTSALTSSKVQRKRPTWEVQFAHSHIVTNCTDLCV